MLSTIEPETLFRVVDIAAVVANGLLGGAVARALRFDMVGFLLLAVVCSMGGGMIRDVLLNAGLPIALTDGWYWVGAITSAALAYVLDLSSNWATRALVVVDFLGMGCWAATGTIKSLTLGLHWLPAIALGVTTAVGGGVIRDIMVNRIPAIFGGNSLYATVAFVGAAETAICFKILERPNVAVAVSVLTCMVLGIVARWRDWRLPMPTTLKVQRPRLLDVFRRDHEHLENEGWAPGTPLTNQLDVITEDQVQAYREQLHREREQRGD